jgi:hypothetical protein
MSRTRRHISESAQPKSWPWTGAIVCPHPAPPAARSPAPSTLARAVFIA